MAATRRSPTTTTTRTDGTSILGTPTKTTTNVAIPKTNIDGDREYLSDGTFVVDGIHYSGNGTVLGKDPRIEPEQETTSTKTDGTSIPGGTTKVTSSSTPYTSQFDRGGTSVKIDPINTRTDGTSILGEPVEPIANPNDPSPAIKTGLRY